MEQFRQRRIQWARLFVYLHCTILTWFLGVSKKPRWRQFPLYNVQWWVGVRVLKQHCLFCFTYFDFYSIFHLISHNFGAGYIIKLALLHCVSSVVLIFHFLVRMGLFGNKSFNKKKTGVRKSVSLNNLSNDPTMRKRDLHPDPDDVSAFLYLWHAQFYSHLCFKQVKFHLPFDPLHADYYPVRILRPTPWFLWFWHNRLQWFNHSEYNDNFRPHFK